MRWIGRIRGALLLTAALPTLLAWASPPVGLDSGLVRGFAEADVTVFRGIPYAAPPIGPLRWRPPQPVTPWRGVRETVAYGRDCSQQPTTEVPGPGFVNSTSEDCLTLNVWAPSKPARKLPVMVWIHGGAFIMGAGSYPTYDGTHFARDGVVLVTFNYRLGLLGFFAHPALILESHGDPVGDYGFMDQIAALRWVRRNIGAFGGDPSNVTIFGESAGGESVNALLVSPTARGLFAKAISESGGGRSQLGGLSWPTLRSAEAKGAAWAASVGIKGDGPGALRALRALPVSELLKVGYRPDFAGPMIDGRVVPEYIDSALADGRHAVVPYMAGSNSDEYSLLQWLPGAAHNFAHALGELHDQALALYSDHGNLPVQSAEERMWGDAVMVAPARALASGMAASGAPAYLYHFSYVPKAMRGKIPGAPHSGEMTFVFANERKVSTFGEGAADQPMADLMHAYWIAFARTSNPNGGGRPVWPMYSKADDALLDFTDNGAQTVKAFDKSGLDLLDQAYQTRLRVK